MRIRQDACAGVVTLCVLAAWAAEGAAPRGSKEPPESKADTTQTENARPPVEKDWFRSSTLSGILDVESRWRDHESAFQGGGEGASDLYVRQFNLGVESGLIEDMSATIILNSEWIGDDVHRGGGKISLEEVHVDLDRPLYIVIGRRSQPFGQFASDLVTDPMAQDAYETKRVGASAGFKTPLGFDLSATVYKGTEQMDQLFQSGLFDTTKVVRDSTVSRNVDSFIGAAQGSPFRNLTIFGAVSSEPGRGTRNVSLDAGFNLVPPAVSRLSLDLEYVRALNRERFAGMDRRFEESVLSATASYAFAIRKPHLLGRRNYTGRRSSHRAHPAALVARYEFFSDDGLAGASHSWSVKSRTSAGGRYAFRESPNLLVYAQGEARRTAFRGVGLARKASTEIYARLGMDF